MGFSVVCDGIEVRGNENGVFRVASRFGTRVAFGATQYC
jgi:hypothetical protein